MEGGKSRHTLQDSEAIYCTCSDVSYINSTIFGMKHDGEDAFSISGTECACSVQSVFRVAELQKNDIDGRQELKKYFRIFSCHTYTHIVLGTELKSFCKIGVRLGC